MAQYLAFQQKYLKRNLVVSRSIFLFLTAVGLFQCCVAELRVHDLDKFVVVVPILMFLSAGCAVWHGSRRGQIALALESPLLIFLGLGMTTSYGALLMVLGMKS
jgi:hypothetical protein